MFTCPMLDKFVIGAKTLVLPPLEAGANALPEAPVRFVLGAMTLVTDRILH